MDGPLPSRYSLFYFSFSSLLGKAALPDNHQPAKVGIVFAMREEERGLRRVLADSRLLAQRAADKTFWNVGGSQLLVAVSGIGGDRAAIATEALIDAGARWVVARGLRPRWTAIWPWEMWWWRAGCCEVTRVYPAARK